jgi:hypothetical protein
MNPNDYIGMRAVVSPKDDDIFPVYTGTVVRIVDDWFKVADAEDYVYDVAFEQLTFLEEVDNG